MVVKISNQHLQKKLNSFFCRFFYCSVFLLASLHGMAQPAGDAVVNKIKDRRSGLFATVSAGFAQAGNINKSGGPYNISARPQPVWEAGVLYRGKISRNIYALGGFKGVVSGRNAMLRNAPVEKIDPNKYSSPFPPLKMTEFDFILSVPLLIEFNRALNNKKNFFVQGGVNLRYSLGYDFERNSHIFYDATGSQVEVLVMEMNSNNNGKPWINFNLGGGLEWRLKNYNLLKAGLLVNISATDYVSGTYRVNIPGESATYGTYAAKGSYIALSISYGFTGINNRLVRQQNKKRR
jgi:hypothetical protein